MQELNQIDGLSITNENDGEYMGVTLSDDDMALALPQEDTIILCCCCTCCCC